MAKSYTIYVTQWTTESDDVERKLRLCNTPSSWLRVSDFFDVRRNVRRHEDCDVMVRWSASSAASRRWSTAFADPGSRVFTTRFEDERPSPARRTSSTAGRVVTVQVRDLDVWSLESARRWSCIFRLVELARWSMVWYILVWILSATVNGLVYFSSVRKWSCEKLAAKNCRYI